MPQSSKASYWHWTTHRRRPPLVLFILMSQLSRWLERTRGWHQGFLRQGYLSGSSFTTAPKATDSRSQHTAHNCRSLSCAIKAACPKRREPRSAPLKRCSSAFVVTLVNERGLADGTVFNHLHAAKLFFNSLDSDISAHLDKLANGPPSVRRFILRRYLGAEAWHRRSAW